MVPSSMVSCRQAEEGIQQQRHQKGSQGIKGGNFKGKWQARARQSLGNGR